MTIPDIQIPITGTYPYVDENGARKNLTGAIDLGQIKTVGKERNVRSKICMLGLEIDEIDKKLLNALGLSGMIKSRDNIINSLQGKVKYLQKKLIE